MTMKDLNKVFLTYMIVDTLLEVGTESTYNKIESILKKEFNCEIEICYTNPEYLKYAIIQSDESQLKIIIDRLKINLKDFADQMPIKNFIKIISSNAHDKP